MALPFKDSRAKQEWVWAGHVGTLKHLNVRTFSEETAFVAALRRTKTIPLPLPFSELEK
jgi:hypothetical protein